jgi:hypothetical protein
MLGWNFGPHEVLECSVNITLRSQLAAITLAAIGCVWFWALAPMTSLLYIGPSSWTDADLVRHLWHFRLAQPEWVSSPPQYDYLRWMQAESIARLGVVFLVWVGSAGWLVRRHLGGRAFTSPNKAVAPNRRPCFTFLRWFKFDRLSGARRSLPTAVGEPRRSAAPCAA